jgi:hypothetical protein
MIWWYPAKCVMMSKVRGGVTGPCLTHELPDICQMTWNLAGALGVWQKSLQHVLVMPNKSVCALRLGGR